MNMIYSDATFRSMKEQRRLLKECDPKKAFELELYEAKKTWDHFSTKKKPKRWA